MSVEVLMRQLSKDRGQARKAGSAPHAAPGRRRHHEAVVGPTSSLRQPCSASRQRFGCICGAEDFGTDLFLSTGTAEYEKGVSDP